MLTKSKITIQMLRKYNFFFFFSTNKPFLTGAFSGFGLNKNSTVCSKIIWPLEIIRVKSCREVLWHKYLRSHDLEALFCLWKTGDDKNLAIKPEKNGKYSRKCSNNFAADYNSKISSRYRTTICVVVPPTLQTT